MAERKTGYPMLPVKQWWTLREKFKQSIPGTVTASYLQQVGIIDEDGKTLGRAREWRDDTAYPSLCAEIAKEIYPAELLEAVTEPASDRAAAERWFSNKTGVGATAAQKMTRFFSVLVDANPGNRQTSRSKGTKIPPSSRRSKNATDRGAAKIAPHEDNEKDGNDEAPSVHINLQIHVSSDATPDQIDKIFESMATHIYRRG